MRSKSAILVASGAFLLGALPLVVAHGGSMEMGMEDQSPKSTNITDPNRSVHALPSYFRHSSFGGWMVAHSLLMIFAWIIAMPVAIMLSIARSRYHLPAQVMFHIFNGLGVFTGCVYNGSTPDLYEHNAHHPIGWIVTFVTVAWTLMSVFVAYGEYQSNRSASMARARQSVAQSMAQFDQLHQYNDEGSPRYSRDSGQGTERNSASLLGSRQNSSESVHMKQEAPLDDVGLEGDELDQDQERQGFLGNNRVDRFLSKNVQRFSTQRASKVIRFLQIVLEKFLLLLGFLSVTTGFVTYGGIFRGRLIFSGLAHFIKGGIFFWYGLLTLGRWMGAFSEFGWAWNVRPNYPLVSKWKAMTPSAEFTESFVIWFYGTSNVFLEHLNNWGGEWAPSDFEHVSITILFFGGGLLGMLIESKWVQDFMSTTVLVHKSEDEETGASCYPDTGLTVKEQEQLWQRPNTYNLPLNPVPALTIMLLGLMMSGHKQESMVSTMMHAQWGGLFSAFALARGATYIVMYLKPPTSHFPGRPPTELVASFCLTAGGLMFMMSASDGVWSIESNGLDAMTIFTITMGLAGIVLAWEMLTFALKGWAVRKERAAVGKPLV